MQMPLPSVVGINRAVGNGQPYIHHTYEGAGVARLSVRNVLELCLSNIRAERAKRDETLWSMYDGPSSTA